MEQQFGVKPRKTMIKSVPKHAGRLESAPTSRPKTPRLRENRQKGQEADSLFYGLSSAAGQNNSKKVQNEFDESRE